MFEQCKTVALLALLHAELGNKNEAVRHARVNEPDLAIAELEKLIGLPNGPTPGTLKIEPEWDSLRGHPRFQKLLEPLR